MKVSAQSLASAPNLVEKSAVVVYADLFKARLTFLVLLTTVVGFYLGSREGVDYLLMVHTGLGTALVASGAAALNQLFERDYDARMKRTADRPLPSGRLQPQAVLKIGILAAVAGLVYLAAAVNVSASVIGACSLLIYLFVYTPLKRVTWLNTAVGAVPGALPPLIGWAGAQGGLTPAGWSLFGILAAWQLPHFMAIAWLYREEYLRAGFRMLSGVDPDGRRTGRHAVVQTAILLLASGVPFLLRQTRRTPPPPSRPRCPRYWCRNGTRTRRCARWARGCSGRSWLRCPLERTEDRRHEWRHPARTLRSYRDLRPGARSDAGVRRTYRSLPRQRGMVVAAHGGSISWTMLAPTGLTPPARQNHTAVYDPVRDRMLVFGGFDGVRRN